MGAGYFRFADLIAPRRQAAPPQDKRRAARTRVMSPAAEIFATGARVRTPERDVQKRPYYESKPRSRQNQTKPNTDRERSSSAQISKEKKTARPGPPPSLSGDQCGAGPANQQLLRPIHHYTPVSRIILGHTICTRFLYTRVSSLKRKHKSLVFPMGKKCVVRAGFTSCALGCW